VLRQHIKVDTGGRDAVAKEVEFGYGKHSLLQVESQPVGGEYREQCPLMLPVMLLEVTVQYMPSSSKKENNII
jgi:hypothetical protein